jgi:hypothetical protein
MKVSRKFESFTPPPSYLIKAIGSQLIIASWFGFQEEVIFTTKYNAT